MGRIFDYKVNYSKYLELRKERREQQQKAYEEQQKFIAETKDFIERGEGGNFRRNADVSSSSTSSISSFSSIFTRHYGWCRQELW